MDKELNLTKEVLDKIESELDFVKNHSELSSSWCQGYGSKLIETVRNLQEEKQVQ